MRGEPPPVPGRPGGLCEAFGLADAARAVELLAPAGAAGWGAAAAIAADFVRAAAGSENGGGRDVTVAVAGPRSRVRPEALARLAGRLLWVTPPSDRERLWCLERCLRCPGVAATVGFLPAGLDPVAGRRLFLAAEEGGGAGVLVRPASAAREPCWAAARLHVAPAAGDPDSLSPRPRWRVSLARRRGSLIPDDLQRGSTWELTDDGRLAPAGPAPIPGALPVPADVAGPAGPPRRGLRLFAADGPRDGTRDGGNARAA